MRADTQCSQTPPSGHCGQPRTSGARASGNGAVRLGSRSKITSSWKGGRRFDTSKKGGRSRQRCSRAGENRLGALHLKACGAVASPPHQFANASGRTRGLEKAALCHAGFKASLGLGWAHAQRSISRTYAPQPSSSASSRRSSASLGSAQKAVPSAGECAGSRSSG